VELAGRDEPGPYSDGTGLGFLSFRSKLGVSRPEERPLKWVSLGSHLIDNTY